MSIATEHMCIKVEDTRVSIATEHMCIKVEDTGVVVMRIQIADEEDYLTRVGYSHTAAY